MDLLPFGSAPAHSGLEPAGANHYTTGLQRQESDVDAEPDEGLVKDLFGSDSHVTAPADDLRMYLYVKAVLGGRETVTSHVGYAAEDMAIALAGVHDPSCGSEPTTEMLSP